MAKQKVSAMHPTKKVLQVGIIANGMVKFSDGATTGIKNVVKYFVD